MAEAATERTTPVLRGPWPVLGLLPALARDTLGVFERARALGEVVRLAVPGRHPVFVISEPRHIRHVLQDNHANYRRTPFHDRLKALLGEGLVTSEGALWQRQRRLLQPAFRAERIRRFVAIMGASAAELAARWQAAEGQVVDVFEAMSGLALEIAIRSLFADEARGEDAGIGEAVLEAQSWLSGRFWSLAPDWTERLPTPANRRFRRAVARLDTVVGGIIARRLGEGRAGDDLLGMLLAAQGGEGGGIEERQVRDEAMTMLIAGHETSAAALAWTWHLLGAHPAVAEALREEAARVLPGGRLPVPEDIAQLDLARAVIQEAMRLYPPVGWFGRLAAGPDRIGGHAIPAGAILVLSPWLVQRDPRHWPDPARFDPGRFAPGMRPAPYTHFPFGGGPRTCIGNHFAMTEMVAALSVLAPRLRLDPVPGAEVRPELFVTLRPRGGLPMRIRSAAPA